MKQIDRVILAVVAVALTVIAINPWVAPGYVNAQAVPMRVNIAEIGGVEIRLPRMEATPAVPVYVMNK